MPSELGHISCLLDKLSCSYHHTFKFYSADSADDGASTDVKFLLGPSIDARKFAKFSFPRLYIYFEKSLQHF